MLLGRNPSGAEFRRLPGGGIEPGETALQAAAREIREELGATLIRSSLRGVMANLFTWGALGGHELCSIVTGALAEPGFADPGWAGLIVDTGDPVS